MRQFTVQTAFAFLLLSSNILAQERPTRVSIIQLIATPERFDGKLVGTYGFLALGWEASVLWLHKEDSDNLLSANALWLDPSPEMRRNASEIALKYVTIVGVFRAFQSGRPGHNKIEGMSGGITNIRSCTVWSDPKHRQTSEVNSGESERDV